MVLCIEPQKIYSPGGCHEIAFPSTFSHNGPRPNCNGVRFGRENDEYNSVKWQKFPHLESSMSNGTYERWCMGNCGQN